MGFIGDSLERARNSIFAAFGVLPAMYAEAAQRPWVREV